MNKTFNLSPNIFSSFIELFCWMVFTIIIAYLLIMGINFLREKFLVNDKPLAKGSFLELIAILGTLLSLAGFGFIVANIFQQVLNVLSNNHMSLPGEWNYLTFGIISVFIGLAFKRIAKTISKKEDNALNR